ncbi:MAG TPA: VOC family protein [Pirellulaceae bacterium]|nr:VOC family protein [Pirellulaceae bacterium]
MYVDDLPRAERFYVDVLELELVSRQEGRHVFFRCGDGMLLLFNPLGSRESGSHDGGIDVPVHGSIGPGHIAFAACEDDLAAWAAHLEHHGVAIERWIDWPGGGRSLYFRDPAGNSLELATPKIWGIPDDLPPG